MAQLWGGRFTKETDELVYRFNASITFDKKLFEQDIEGSIAHVVMLEKQGILTCEEKDAIVKGLTGIRKDVEEGSLVITDEYEDIHSFVEAHDLSGKTIIPFVTHGTGGLSGTIRDLTAALPENCEVLESYDVFEDDVFDVQDEVNEWLSGLGY